MSAKAPRISEDTEVRLSLRDIFGILVAVVTVTSIVVRYEIKIDDLDDQIDKLHSHVQQNSGTIKANSDFVRTIQLDQIRNQKDIQYILQGNTQCQIK